MLVPEYDDRDPSTWVLINEPTVDSSFDGDLVRIAGLNRFGEPNLVRRWGVTYRDPMTEADEPKYLYVVKNPTLIGFEFKDDSGTHFVKRLEEVPASVLIPIPKYNDVRLGERRWIIEQWRSPEFLARSGRYKHTHDTGESETKVSCRNCGSQMLIPTGREDEKVCGMCGSKRQSTVEVREIKNERLLKDFPVRGAYDHFLTLQTAAGLYHPADSEALEGIRRKWNFERNHTFAEKEAMRKRRVEKQLINQRQREVQIWS